MTPCFFDRTRGAVLKSSRLWGAELPPSSADEHRRHIQTCVQMYVIDPSVSHKTSANGMACSRCPHLEIRFQHPSGTRRIVADQMHEVFTCLSEVLLLIKHEES